MTSTVSAWPTLPQQRIAWIQERLPAWIEHAEELGLQPEDVMQLQALADEARDDLMAARQARSIARAATGKFQASAAGAGELAAALIGMVRSRAVVTGNPEVFNIAMVNPPAPKSAAPPPEIPSRIVTSMLNGGEVQVRWKFRSPRLRGGTTFEIQRRLAGETIYTHMGITSEKSWTDSTIPAGTHWASYRLRARRGRKLSDYSEAVIMYFAAMTGAKRIEKAEMMKAETMKKAA